MTSDISLVSGYTVCGLYPTEKTAASIFDPRLLRWITTFYAVSFAQSVLTTSLMAYRIWQTDRRGAKYRTNHQSHLLPVMRILIESAALQMVVEVVLLILYSANSNAQYILLELVTPLVVRAFPSVPCATSC